MSARFGPGPIAPFDLRLGVGYLTFQNGLKLSGH
jgi:hypothetical protein